METAQEQDDGYIFILDDDIVPADYVKKMIARIDHYQLASGDFCLRNGFYPPFQDCGITASVPLL